MQQLEANHALTTLYIMIEVGRTSKEAEQRKQFRDAISELWTSKSSRWVCLLTIYLVSVEPNLLLLLTQILAKSRWEDLADGHPIQSDKVSYHLRCIVHAH